MKKEYIELQNIIENHYLEYEEYLTAQAKLAFEKYVKPYLIKNKYSMSVWNGDYVIFSKDKSGWDLMDTHPQYIIDILDLEVPVMWSNNTLGCWMPSFKYEEE